MFRVFFEVAAIHNRVRIVDKANKSADFICKHYPFRDECGGFVTAERDDANYGLVNTIDQVQVVHVILKSQNWYETYRWIGWFDQSGNILFVCKDVTDTRFSIKEIRDLLNLDFSNLYSGPNLEITLHFNCISCSTIDELTKLLSTEINCAGS